MKRRLVIIIIALIFIGGIVGLFRAARQPGPLAPFARCLTERGAAMYGTSWCAHCKKQKDLFGRDFRNVRYVECSLRGNPQAQAPVCREAGITGYPTWLFADGSQLFGEQNLEALAQKTGCTLLAK